MNLIEALKTGRPIRRAGDETYLSPESFDDLYCPLSREAILAEDWEIKPDSPEFSLADCIAVLTGRDYLLTISNEMRLSLLHHLITLGTSCLCSSKKESVPNSIVCGVEKY